MKRHEASCVSCGAFLFVIQQITYMRQTSAINNPSNDFAPLECALAYSTDAIAPRGAQKGQVL